MLRAVDGFHVGQTASPNRTPSCSTVRSRRNRRDVSYAGGSVEGNVRGVHRRDAVDDPLCYDAPDPAAGQDAEGVQASRDEVAVKLGGGPDQRPNVGGERLGPAEERAHAGVRQARDPREGRSEERLHPFPVRRELAEREVPRDPVQRPRRADRLEQADEHAVALRPVVAVVIRVLDHRQVRVHSRHGVGQQVVVLGGLERHGHPGERAELARPHPGRVDHDLRLDAAGLGQHGRDPAAAGLHAGRGHALDDLDATLPGALGERGCHADRVGPPLVGHVEAGQHVIGARQRPYRRDLGGGDLGILDAESVHPGCFPPQRLLPLRRGRQRDMADGAESGGVPGLGFQPGVQVARVPAEEQRGLVGHPGRGDQAGRVPGRSGGERVLLQQDHVGPAQVGQVVGDAAADHPAADDHYLGAVGHPAGDLARHPAGHLRAV